MGYTECFPSCYADLGVHLLVTVCSGNLWSCLKELSCLLGNAGWLWNQCRVSGPHLAVRENRSWFLSSCAGNLGFTLELQRGCSLNTLVFSVMSGLLSSFQGHLGILLESWQDSRDASRVEEGDAGSLSSCHWDIGIPIDF